MERSTDRYEENYGGHNVVKVFNKEQDVVAEFEKDNKKLYESAWKSQFFSGMMMPVMQFVGNLGYVMVAFLGGIFTIKGSIEVGDIQSFFQYIRNFTNPIQQIAQVVNLLQSSAAASERVFEFLEEPEEQQTAENPVSVKNLTGDVQFEHVSFGYNPDKIIIHDFSADITDGQKIAIVGPTGAGKTTMVKLLMRFYDVNSGRESWLTDTISKILTEASFVKCLEWYLRTPGCFPEPLWKIFGTDGWMPQTKR